MNKTLYTVLSQSEAETISFAQSLAKELNPGDILLLHGDLGMGKTVLSRAIIRCICAEDNMEVPSPTFTLVQNYDSALGTLWHFDLYRLCDSSEVYEIGWEEALSGGEGITIVEWPERLENLLPEDAINIYISPVEGQSEARQIEVKNNE